MAGQTKKHQRQADRENIMKNFVWGAFVAVCVVHLGGCAFPEKPLVRHPPATTSSSQSSPVYIPESSKPADLEQPGYMEIEEHPLPAADESVAVVLPSAAYVNDRIFEYGRKLDRWKELDRQSVNMKLKDGEAEEMVGCFRRLQEILNGYGELRTKILRAESAGAATGITNQEIFELQQNDIAFLEESCGRLLADSEDKSAGWHQREEGADLSQLETLMDRYAASKEYQEIVKVWLKIPESELSRVHLRSKILYANALRYLNQQGKAAEIYQQAVDRMSASDEQATDLVSLRKMLADLYTATGNYRLAAEEYKNISDEYLKIGELEEWSKLQLSILNRGKDGSPELDEYSQILRNFLGYVPERDGYKIIWQAENFQTSYPYSLVTSNVDFIKESVVKAADNWFNGLVAEVDALAREKKFTEARKRLEAIPTDIISAEKQLVLKAKNEELELAQAVENEAGKMAQMQDLQNQWNNGMLLANSERFEEAIVVFTSLLNSEYSSKAEAKIKELSLQAAKEDRRKAADFFIRFTRTTDPESRKKLLVESHKLLKNILVKYPEVEIAEKVRGNIERVEQEMNAIDPNLVFMADQGAAPIVQDNSVDNAFSMPGTKTMSKDQAPIIETDKPMPVSQ